MKRPLSTLVFGILNLVFAAWGLLSLVSSAAMLLSCSAGNAAGNPVIKLVLDNPNYWLFLKISMIAGLAAIVVLALAGVGLLLLKGWGRQLSIIYAVYSIFAAIVGTAINYHFFVAPIIENASKTPSGPAHRGDNRRRLRLRRLLGPDLPDPSPDLHVSPQCCGGVER